VRGGGDVGHPLLEVRSEVKAGTMLVLTANRGMCGGYNSGILRLANRQLHEMHEKVPTLHLEVSGKRGIGAFRFRKVKMDHEFIQFEDKPTFEQVDELASRYYEEFVSGKIDRLDVVYQKFVSLSRQYPVVETLLPFSGGNLDDELLGKDAQLAQSESQRKKTAAELKQAAQMAQAEKVVSIKKSEEKAVRHNAEFEFLPSAQSILDDVVPYAFRIRLYKCFLDAAVGEQIARMVAMKAATENADGIIGSLTTAYNRARQSQITSEISEIIGGAAALEN
ncbi:MAG: F0F1 ATP synthase subunit gamma, partial [Thermoguttaceae bacterium]